MGIGERALLERTSHLTCSLAPTSPIARGSDRSMPHSLAALDDELVGPLVLPGLVTLGGHAPRSDGVRITLSRLALATAVRMIHRVHGDAADPRATPQPPASPGLADAHGAMLPVADDADGGAALEQHQANRSEERRGGEDSKGM